MMKAFLKKSTVSEFGAMPTFQLLPGFLAIVGGEDLQLALKRGQDYENVIACRVAVELRSPVCFPAWFLYCSKSFPLSIYFPKITVCDLFD
ncbi:hypothetical protein ETSB_1061 [cyanobacterium endosymbiont of Epithemia turgida isolate EtSB Lake Yunoko]|nr:hypothetical protein ETSB_1061 [cyanobacterium endosymbiont of Epithemia turgida isolate EtSB Lake Yunoko]